VVARRAALVAALALLLAPTSAAATEVSRTDLGALASEASEDPAALEELRAVTSVEGVPVDLEAVLAGAEQEELAARLNELAAAAEAAPATDLDAAEARARVEEILAGDPPEPPPAPDGGGGQIELPTLGSPLAIVIAVIVIGLAALTASRAGQRTILEREAAAGGTAAGTKRTKARDLSREADDAERRGDFAVAVRLRFQAGLTRLDELGTIELRPSLTATGAVRESGIGEIAGLATAYERVAFGGRGASARDAEAQRSGWSEVVNRARGRS
jgi:hypothetical protein